MALTPDERERYARHLLLPEVGEEGQEALRAGRVLVVGAGGLGSPCALYLAAAGVGTLGIIDADAVELSNLQRQLLHATDDLGRAKVESASETLSALNPDVKLVMYPERLTASNAPEVLAGYDFVVDATDNFESKFLIADACYAAGKPYAHAGILRFGGQAMTVLPGESACYRCVFGGPPPGPVPEAARGLLGVLPGVIGTVQATEALKFLLGVGELLTDTLLVYDALKMTFRRVGVKRDPGCILCGDK
ncbi:MAG: HesA/MoeB/ThiF family protein [Kiritimatiellae bacterium]|nr:HesA/MoeB/ThiF family protein [Kiritimatiellia bacterium]